jgi:hypothetical protein
MTKEGLSKILEDHKLWLSGCGGKKANLYGANLYGADLYGANLSGADLSGADLYGANLSGADLSGANLSGANLSGADLYGANLYGANLSGADLSGADLSGADLYGANLSKVNLSGANLYGADLPTLLTSRLSILPDEGDIIGWKKCMNGVLVKLKIPHGVKRSNATGRKCRAERVEVLEVIGGDVGISKHDGCTKYVVGETIVCDVWGEDRWVECAGGIHFFITRAEAEAY